MTTEKKSKGVQRDTLIDAIFKKLNEIDFKGKPSNIDLAIEIERGCFNEIISKCKRSPEAYIQNWNRPMFVSLYSARCAIILSKVTKDSYMMKKLESGEWTGLQIGKKTADELDPESSAAIKENIAARIQQRVTQKTSNLYKCAKCGLKNTTPPTGKQNRSLDEGQSQYVTCLTPQCNSHRFQVR